MTNKLYKELLGTGQGRKDVVNSLIQKVGNVRTLCAACYIRTIRMIRRYSGGSRVLTLLKTYLYHL